MRIDGEYVKADPQSGGNRATVQQAESFRRLHASGYVCSVVAGQKTAASVVRTHFLLSKNVPNDIAGIFDNFL